MKSKNLLLWACRIIAALIMLQTLYFKFTAAPESVYIFSQVGMEPEGRIATAFAELLASILILIPRTSLIGLARSVGWLEMFVGVEWIHERTSRLASRLKTSLLTADGVELLTPPDTLGGIVSFRIKNWSSDQAVDELSRGIHALINQKPDIDAVVASVAWFNTEDELDAFTHAVADLAAHTPETMPRRPSLIVLADS